MSRTYSIIPPLGYMGLLACCMACQIAGGMWRRYELIGIIVGALATAMSLMIYSKQWHKARHYERLYQEYERMYMNLFMQRSEVAAK